MYFQTTTTNPSTWKNENVEISQVEIVENQNQSLKQPKPSESLRKEKYFANDLYMCLRPILLVGNLIGFTPVDGLYQNNTERLSFRRKSIKGFLVVLVMFSLTFNALIGAICLLRMETKKLADIVWAANPIIFFSVGSFGYIYMFLYMDHLLQIIKNWQRIKLSFECEDNHLKRDTYLIFIIIFSSAVLENLLQQTIQMSLFDFTRIMGESDANKTASEVGMTAWEKYYHRTKQPQWEVLFPYHPSLSVLMFFCNKCALYTWNLLDIFIIVVSRALYFKFKDIARFAQTVVIAQRITDIDNKDRDGFLSSNGNKAASRIRIRSGGEYTVWEGISTDFESLHALLEDIKKFLSPILFVSYTVNLFFIIVHLHMGLTPVKNKGAAAEIYRTWSFVHITGRIYLITLFAARINEFAEEFVDIIRKCPTDCYSKKVERIERFIRTSKPGVGGLNCFVVTKPFMLNLVSVVLTFEIVLLQTSGFSYF